MSRVQLYVYDLSGGLAKALSLQMTGKQIDGIWHTSVVVFGKEIFYGQGISITLPGRSHHGNPLQIIDFGETAIDEETFNEYLTEIREHYTADKYHLLDFNCNSFTNDVIGFLTGQHIPDWIRDLPADFLSTPFGASLRPTIDNMFRRPTPGSTPPISQTPARAPPPSDVSNLLLQAVAQRAASGAAQGPSRGAPATSTVAGPMHISTNTASFNSLLETRKVAIALFTSANCGPCRMIEPAFEDYAREKGGPDIAFIKVSLDGMGGQGIAAQYGVRATPTFLFFLDGRKTDELKGANQSELKTQIDLLLYQAFPPHTHMSLDLPVLKRLSTQPTIYEQLPDLSKLLAKLSTTAKSLDVATAETSLGDVAEIVRTRGERGVTDQTLAGFEKTSDALLAGAAAQDLFPLVDLWRLALLVEGFAARCMVHFTGLSKVLDTVSAHLQGLGPSAPKALALTGLRLQSNIVANTALLRQLFQSRENRSSFTQTLISGLLHEDAGVRTVASTLVFNIGTHLQRSRRESPTRPDPVEDGDWEVEVLTALLESLSSESDPGVVHRLVSAFGFIVLLSPWYKDQTQPLLEVLEAKKVLSLTAASAQDVDVKKLANECVLLCGSA